MFRPPKLLKTSGYQWERFCLFALLPKYKLESSIVDLHSLLWKQFIAQLVRIELEGEKFDATQVWAPAWARLEKKVLALKFKVNEIKRRAESRGEEIPDLSKRSKSYFFRTPADPPATASHREREHTSRRRTTLAMQTHYEHVSNVSGMRCLTFL